MSDTPITDANVCITTKEGCETIAPDICRKFERENAAMREQIEHLGKANSMLHLDLVDAHAETAKETKRADKLEAETAAMREAIRVAHEAIVLSLYPDPDALAKLQPFLKP